MSQHTGINAIAMDKCQTAEEVRDLLRAKAGDGQVAMLFWGDEMVCAAVPLEVAREQLCQTVLERWGDHPEAVGELLEHFLKTEVPEEWKPRETGGN